MASDVEFLADEQRLRPDKSEVQRLWCDNSKIKRITKFSPQISLAEGLRRTVEWFSNEQQLKKYKVDVYNV
jgi:nucleoside-diphosphate-sugar epimerase